jgi:hypothetical protein
MPKFALDTILSQFHLTFHPHIIILEETSLCYPPIFFSIFQVVSFHNTSPPKFCMHFVTVHSSYMLSSLYPSQIQIFALVLSFETPATFLHCNITTTSQITLSNRIPAVSRRYGSSILEPQTARTHLLTSVVFANIAF